MPSNNAQRRERHKREINKQATVIDMHDLLHSIFWGKPTREEMRPIWTKLEEAVESRKVNQMQAEVDELVEFSMTRLPKREGWEG